MGYIQDLSLVLDLPLWKLDGTSFMSEDAYGHLCTATGALWTPQGRSFDGDDKVDCGSSSILKNLTSGLTLCAWQRISDVSGYPGIAGNKTQANWTSNVGYELFLDAAGFFRGRVGSTDLTGNVDYGDGNWHFMVLSWADGSAMQGFVDAEEISYATQGTPSNVSASTANLLVGLYYGDRYHTDKIGEVLLYSRVLTTQEIQRIYLATKWRYR